MTAPDLDVIKEIPGYKVILKAILKSQIQQLVEQLATTTEEETIILTASVSDGTLSHSGSDSAKGFLEDHEDVKSQFLGYCLKTHHKRKQQEKERKEAEEALALQQRIQAQQNTPPRFAGYSPRSGNFMGRSPRYTSPRMSPGLHPVGLSRASGASPRHQPYAVPRGKRPSGPGIKSPTKNGAKLIKREPEIGDDGSNQSAGDGGTSPPSSPSQTAAPSTPSNVKSESAADDDARSNSSTSTIPNESGQEGLTLGADLSNLISGDSNQSANPQTSDTDAVDPNVNVKLEAITESEMELEITGVEPGRPVPEDEWAANMSTLGMNFEPGDGGAMGSAADMAASQGGYSADTDTSTTPIPIFTCHVCCKIFASSQKLHRHLIIHTGEKPYQCSECSKKFSDPSSLKRHQKHFGH